MLCVHPIRVLQPKPTSSPTFTSTLLLIPPHYPPGDVTAAIIGTSVHHMTVIGDAVNVASRM